MEGNLLKPFNFWLNFSFIIILVLSFYFTGCASLTPTKPNDPFTGKYPKSFDTLALNNPLLVKELGKIPEIQDGISGPEEAALRDLTQIYFNNPEAFDRAFHKIYHVGIPEVRKYCSPLQAIFWLAQDGKQFNDIIEGYSLKGLLGRAWTKDRAWKTMFTPDEFDQIRDGLVGRLKNQHRVYLRNYDKAAVDWIVGSFKGLNNERKKYFSLSTRSLIKKAIKRSEEGDPRWGDFDAVADRLNAPYLVHHYIKEFIQYRTIPQITYPPKTVHKRGWGDSDDLANLGRYVLDKAGYKTFWELMPLSYTFFIRSAYWFDFNSRSIRYCSSSPL